MRVAIDAEGIEAAFKGENDCLEEILRSSILGITTEIIDDYTNKLLREASGLGKEWLEKRVFNNPERMLIVNAKELERYELDPEVELVNAYVGAAYYNGHKLIRDNSIEADATSVRARSYGLFLYSSKDFTADFRTLPGNEVIHSLKLSSRTRYAPKEIDSYFCNEKEVCIYDRYITENTIGVIERLVKKCHPNFTLTLISEFEDRGKSVFSAEDVKLRLKRKFKGATISCCYVNFKELEDKHDRHIYLGRRIQLTFTSGLDCFGCHPAWKNSEGNIYAHILDEDSAVKEYPVRGDGPEKKKRIIKVRSKV